MNSDSSAGRITFRLRVGVTGHRGLHDQPELDVAIREQLGRLIDRLEHEATTTVELAVISQLADGGDRIVVQQVLEFGEERQQQTRLEALLPMPREAYAEAQNWDADTRAEFYTLLKRASRVTELDHAHGEHAYEAAGRRLIASCDVLLALWDGQETGGRGGTAETLREAAARGKPCVWIPTDPDLPVTNNFGPGESYVFFQEVDQRAKVPLSRARPPLMSPGSREDALASLLESLDHLEHYNRERLPAKFGERLDQEFPGDSEDWIAPFFLRATMLAGEYQTRFTRSAQVITLLAIVAAAFLGVHLSLSSNPICNWGEVASLVAITAIFFVLRLREFHERWISYRFLAERLRSARFLIPAGVDFPIFSTTVTAYIERHPSDWIQRTFDEFWQHERRKHAEPKDDALRHRLADEWIGKQITYHENREKDHRKWQLILQTAILVLFAAAVICAILDASAVSRSVMGFLSVLFPAAAASLGALLTVRQHQQLSERSHQISSDLKETQWQITNADNWPTIVSTAARAARIMAEENDDWLGALWFLDVDHPG